MTSSWYQTGSASVSQNQEPNASALPRAEERRTCSGDLLHPAPALDCGPDAAVEPKAIDRRRRLDRVDPVEPNAGPLEAAFLQHPARRRVGDARASL